MKLISVSKQHLVMKMHFFFYFAGTSSVFSFLALIARQVGLSEIDTGFLFAFLPLLGLFCKVFFGSLADKFQIQKILFLMSIALSALFQLCIPFLSNIHFTIKGNLFCFANNGYINISNSINIKENFSCYLQCQVQIKTSLQDCEKNPQEIRIDKRVQLYDFDNETQYIKVFSSDEFNEDICHSFDQNSFAFCPTNHVICELKCPVKYIHGQILSQQDLSIYNTFEFWLLVIVFSLLWSAVAVAVSLGDTLCINLLSNPVQYGKQRLWGTVGWGISAILGGYLVDIYSKGLKETNYMPIFIIAAGALLIDFILCLFFFKIPKFHCSKHFFKDIGNLFCQIRILIPFLIISIIGINTGIVWQFLFWYVDNISEEWGNTRHKLLEGLMQGVQCLLAEVPFFFISGKLLNYFGHHKCLTYVLCTFGIRFVLYSLLHNPWLILPIELMHGVTFGLFYATMISFAHHIAPEGTSATVQGIADGIFEGFGASTGSMIAGIMFHKYGGRFTFLWIGIGSIICGILYELLKIFRCIETKIINSKLNEESSEATMPSDVR